MSSPTESQQLKGKSNARAWKEAFKIAAMSKGYWDVFTGVFVPVVAPDPALYKLTEKLPAGLSDPEKDGKESGDGARAGTRHRPSITPA